MPSRPRRAGTFPISAPPSISPSAAYRSMVEPSGRRARPDGLLTAAPYSGPSRQGTGMGLRAKLIIAFGVIAIAVAALAYRATRPPEIYVFAGVAGPDTPTILPPPVATPWQKYSGGSPSRLAILLTDEDAPWLGLAHGLKSIGVPFAITTDYAEAVRHRVVLVYPRISGQMSAEALKALAALPRDGGTLIAVNVLGGGLEEVFG